MAPWDGVHEGGGGARSVECAFLAKHRGTHCHTTRKTMPKGQEGKKKDNKPKLTTAEKQKKKKEKEAKKK